MRTPLKSIAKAAIARQLSILFILLIGIIGVQTITSCSGGDDPGDNPPSGNQLAGNPEYDLWKEYYKYYDPDDERQRCNKDKGIVEEACKVDGETIWYNPLTHDCNKVGYICVGLVCEGTYELGTLEFCGSEIFASTPNDGRRCQGGVFQRKCGDGWYNYETHYCDGEKWDLTTNTVTGTVKARQRCGSKYYIAYDSERCNNGVVERICGFPDENPVWYNVETHHCSYDITSMTSTTKPIERCGSKYIVDDHERCNNGVVEDRCGDGANAAWYNEITQSCDYMNGTVKPKQRCGG